MSLLMSGWGEQRLSFDQQKKWRVDKEKLNPPQF
jgi:hypothetical protein